VKGILFSEKPSNIKHHDEKINKLYAQNKMQLKATIHQLHHTLATLNDIRPHPIQAKIPSP